MSEHSQSHWSCRLCHQRFPTSGSLRADLQAHQILVRDLLAELEISAVKHAQYQPLGLNSESSDASEDENDQNLTLPTKTTIKGSSDSDSKLRCPHTSCLQENPLLHKSSLNRHYRTHIEINEKCAFCSKSFTRLRSFVEHLDRYCKEKKDLKEGKLPLNEKQRSTITCKDNWCKYSTTQLNQQLAKIKGTEGEERLVARDPRSYSNGKIKGARKGATPDSLAPTGNNGGDGDGGSTNAGSSSLTGAGIESYNNETTEAIGISGTPGPSLPTTHDCGQSTEDIENKEISAWPMNVGDIQHSLSVENPLQQVSSPSELFEVLKISRKRRRTDEEQGGLQMQTK